MFTEKKFESVKTPGEYLDYLEYAPETDEKLPLIIHVHGAGNRGSDISKMAHGGALGELEKGRKINAVVVAPQCHSETWFELFHVLLEFIDDRRNRPDIDIDRVYVMGISMGGYCTWQLCISRPDWFAAAVPVCGGGMYWEADKFRNIAVWAFHGALDESVLPEESVHMVRSINQCGGHAKITIVPDCDHNVWDYTFASDEMWDWLFKQKKER